MHSVDRATPAGSAMSAVGVTRRRFIGLFVAASSAALAAACQSAPAAQPTAKPAEAAPKKAVAGAFAKEAPTLAYTP